MNATTTTTTINTTTTIKTTSATASTATSQHQVNDTMTFEEHLKQVYTGEIENGIDFFLHYTYYTDDHDEFTTTTTSSPNTNDQEEEQVLTTLSTACTTADFVRIVLKEMMICARDGLDVVMPFIFKLIMTLLLFLLALVNEFEWPSTCNTTTSTTTTSGTITSTTAVVVIPNISQDQAEEIFHLPVTSQDQDQDQEQYNRSTTTEDTRMLFEYQEVLQDAPAMVNLLLPVSLLKEQDNAWAIMTTIPIDQICPLVDSIKQLQFMLTVWMLGQLMNQYQIQLRMLCISQQNWNNQKQLDSITVPNPLEFTVKRVSTPTALILKKKQQNDTTLQEFVAIVVLPKLLYMYQYQPMVHMSTRKPYAQPLLLCVAPYDTGVTVEMDIIDVKPSEIQETHPDTDDESQPEETEEVIQVNMGTLDHSVSNDKDTLIPYDQEDTKLEVEPELESKFIVRSEPFATATESESHEVPLEFEEDPKPESDLKVNSSLQFIGSLMTKSDESQSSPPNAPEISSKRIKSSKPLEYGMRFEDDHFFPVWRKCQIKFEDNSQMMILQRKWKKTIVPIEDLRSVEYINRRESSIHKTSTFVRVKYVCRHKNRSKWTCDDSDTTTSKEYYTVSLLLRARDLEAKISLLYHHRWMNFRGLQNSTKVEQKHKQYQEQKRWNGIDIYYVSAAKARTPVVDGGFI